jgi:23S rRNA (uracil1939-C5)-methyltransferase
MDERFPEVVEDGMELPRGVQKGDRVVFEVERLGERGRGIGSLEVVVGPQREVIGYEAQARKVVPGDVVEGFVERSRKRVLQTHVESFRRESGSRIEPRCRHFGFRRRANEGCGGCTLQAMSYEDQLAAKERRVRALFDEEGLDVELLEPIVATEPWYYRNKMEFSFGDDGEGCFGLGMHPTGYRHEVIRMEECFLESEFASDFAVAIRRWAERSGLRYHAHGEGWLRQLVVREGKRTGETLVELVTAASDEVQMGGESRRPREVAELFAVEAIEAAGRLGRSLTSLYWTEHRARRGEPTRMIEHLLRGAEVFHEELHLPGGRELRFAIHPRAFFQPNTLGAERLYAEALAGTGLLEEPGGSVLDLYCGTGTIGLAMASWAERVVGVEMIEDAVENARRNAETNDLDNIRFFVGDVADVLETEAFSEAIDRPDLIVVDPPRAGLQPAARQQLAALAAPRIVYISCNPETLARDLVELTEEAGYVLRRARPVDMFPQTWHIECVTVLERGDS